MKRTSQRMVAIACIAGLMSGCAVTRKQRTYSVIGAAVFTAGTAGYAFSRFLKQCPDHAINGAGDECEADRIDDRNQWAAISLVGLLATIGLQLLPISDPEKPAPSMVAIAPPPPPPLKANSLHDPMAVELAQNARNLAAAGKCVEAFGSLRALSSIDKPMADQLRAWDPTVSRCRTASDARGSDTAVEVVAPTPAPAGPGAQPSTVP